MGMDAPKTLVTFYSRTGNTRKVAQTLASHLACEIEEIVDTRDRLGPWGYVRSMLEALSNRTTQIKPPLHKPEDQDLVIIGTPVWAGTIATPVRTYLLENRNRFRNVAFFVTHGGSGDSKTFNQMEKIAGVIPLALLELTLNEVRLGNYSDEIVRFENELRSAFSHQKTG